MDTEPVASRAKPSDSGPDIGAVARARRRGRGPTIWLAGEPDDLKEWMAMGAAGIVTNTVVLNHHVAG